MPTYVYETITADGQPVGERFEVEQRMRDPALTHHPDTGAPVRRVVSGGLGFIGVAEKGSGPSAASGPGICPHSGQACGCH